MPSILANAVNMSTQGAAYVSTTGSWSGVDGSTSGFVLTSNGTGVAPSFKVLPTPASACSFFSVANTTQNPAAAANTTVNFGTAIFNNGSVFAANTFTAPTSSKLYTFFYQLFIIVTGTGDNVFFYKNGSSIAAFSSYNLILGSYSSVQGSVTLSLNAGDTITVVYGNNQVATTPTIYGTAPGAYYTWFSGYQIT